MTVINKALAIKIDNRTKLMTNVLKYLTTHTLEDYLLKFGTVVLSGEYAKSGTYLNEPQLYLQTIKMFTFYGDNVCDEPDYASRREN